MELTTNRKYLKRLLYTHSREKRTTCYQAGGSREKRTACYQAGCFIINSEKTCHGAFHKGGTYERIQNKYKKRDAMKDISSMNLGNSDSLIINYIITSPRKRLPETGERCGNSMHYTRIMENIIDRYYKGDEKNLLEVLDKTREYWTQLIKFYPTGWIIKKNTDEDLQFTTTELSYSHL